MDKTESDARKGSSDNGNHGNVVTTEPKVRKPKTVSVSNLPCSCIVKERTSETTSHILQADARNLPLKSNFVDLIVTSPPYWNKRDYGAENQLGLESTVEQYIEGLMSALREWKRVLRKTGSIFLNIGDSYHNRSLVGIPWKLEAAAMKEGWIIRNRIIWAKDGGMPDPARNRLANRYEFIIHLVAGKNYYYDLFDYAEKYGNGSNPGDIWHISPNTAASNHLAPFPEELVERAIVLACPKAVCQKCGAPSTRIVKRTARLNAERPQARRAMEIAREAGLTPEHIAAIQATGVSDAGKALLVQNGTGRNAARVKELAAEAKKVLGGYFREFTFAQKETVDWTNCNCDAPMVPGMVLDPFLGSGTTLRVANRMGRSSVGTDLKIMC